MQDWERNVLAQLCALKEHSCLLLGGSRLILNEALGRRRSHASDGALLECPNIEIFVQNLWERAAVVGGRWQR